MISCIGMQSMSLYDPYGNEMDISYRTDYTMGSLVVVIALLFCGLLICSRDKAFKMDKLDALDAFIQNDQQCRIGEARRLKKAKFLLFANLSPRN